MNENRSNEQGASNPRGGRMQVVGFGVLICCLLMLLGGMLAYVSFNFVPKESQYAERPSTSTRALAPSSRPATSEQAAEKPGTVSIGTVSVVVAARSLSRGARLDRDDLEALEVPTEQASPAAIAVEQQPFIEGRFIAGDVKKGEPLDWDLISSVPLPPSGYALHTVSFESAPEELTPGAEVAVMWQAAGQNKAAASKPQVVAKKATVATIDRPTSGKEKGLTATLLLTPDESTRLGLAAAAGTLSALPAAAVKQEAIDLAALKQAVAGTTGATVEPAAKAAGNASESVTTQARRQAVRQAEQRTQVQTQQRQEQPKAATQERPKAETAAKAQPPAREQQKQAAAPKAPSKAPARDVVETIDPKTGKRVTYVLSEKGLQPTDSQKQAPQSDAAKKKEEKSYVETYLERLREQRKPIQIDGETIPVE